MKCSTCEGPFHPATGHAFSAITRICGTCAGRFWAWVVRHTSAKGGRRRRRVPTAASFYEAAATSIRARPRPCSACGEMHDPLRTLAPACLAAFEPATTEEIADALARGRAARIAFEDNRR